MLSRVRTAALWGLEAFPVECEVDVGPGLPGFTLVGLPDPSVREVRDRVWPALRNAGFRPPDRRVTVNLAPAGRRKEGAGVDLAVAIGLLAATEQVPLENTLSRPQGLPEHLNWQLSMSDAPAPVREVAQYLVGNIDEDSARVLAAASPEQVVIDLTRRGSGRGAAAPARS